MVLLAALTANGCGAPTVDLSGYPDKEQARLYADGRTGGDKGLVDFDLRRAWQDVTE